MFGLLGDEKTFVGIDIGTSAIKIVELKLIENKPQLTNYAWMEIGGVEGMSPEIFEEVIPDCLKRMFNESGISKYNVNISIPSFGGLVTLIEFPSMSMEDLDKAIKFEAHKYIPTSIDEVVISWDIVGKKRAKGGSNLPVVGPEGHVSPEEKLQILLVAAPRKKVMSFEAITKECRLELDSIEIESFSLVRSLVGFDQGNFLIIDIGSRVCNIILVEKSQIKINRNIDAGGKNITNEIAKSMNIDESRAEKMKISGKNFFGKDSTIVFPVLQSVVDESKRVINTYAQDTPNFKIDKIILSGGTAGFPGITEYFSQAFGMEAVVGNPLGRINFDQKLSPKLDKIKFQLSVSIGLALKGAEEYILKKVKNKN